MKIKEIRDMTSNELTGKLRELKEEMFNLRFQNATNQLENPMRIAVVRKDIAKVMTVIKEQELGLRVEG